MNAHHADAVALYAQVLAGAEGEDWRMTGCDSEGFDIRSGGRVHRVAFARPIAEAAWAQVEALAG